jgi:hypothetical protein
MVRPLSSLTVSKKAASCPLLPGETAASLDRPCSTGSTAESGANMPLSL